MLFRRPAHRKACFFGGPSRRKACFFRGEIPIRSRNDVGGASRLRTSRDPCPRGVAGRRAPCGKARQTRLSSALEGGQRRHDVAGCPATRTRAGDGPSAALGQRKRFPSAPRLDSNDQKNFWKRSRAKVARPKTIDHSDEFPYESLRRAKVILSSLPLLCAPPSTPRHSAAACAYAPLRTPPRCTDAHLCARCGAPVHGTHAHLCDMHFAYICHMRYTCRWHALQVSTASGVSVNAPACAPCGWHRVVRPPSPDAWMCHRLDRPVGLHSTMGDSCRRLTRRKHPGHVSSGSSWSHRLSVRTCPHNAVRPPSVDAWVNAEVRYAAAPR